jgi:hypothetical protein
MISYDAMTAFAHETSSAAVSRIGNKQKNRGSSLRSVWTYSRVNDFRCYPASYSV